MSEISTEKLAEIEALAKKATPGPWEADSMKSEGSYGIGDETYEGFNAFKVTDEKGNTICDTLNSDMGEVHVEYDEDGATAWDEIGRRNAAYIAACDPQTVLALLASHAALAAEVERLRHDVERHMQIASDLESELTAARESAAREMRKRCIEITRKFMCREDTVIGAEEIEAEIIALPLTPADGAKDETRD